MSVERDAAKLVAASEALKQASQCLKEAGLAMQRVRSTRMLLETCEAESTAALSKVSERCVALDAAKLAVVVAEGDVDAIQSPDSSGVVIDTSTP